MPAPAAPAPPTLVLYASQTGQAEALAWQTGGWLHAAGTPARVMPLNEVDRRPAAPGAESALFIASTYGEGDAPDGASVFAEHVMGAQAELSSLRYAVLALGDRQYANFCRFGRLLDEWLHAAGATRSFERIEVDNAEAATLAAWQAQCGGGAPADDAADPWEAAAPVAVPWRLASRTLLNEGSAGAPVYRLAFAPMAAPAAGWESGDIARLVLASDPGRPRDYSIASIPADGRLELLVRQEQHRRRPARRRLRPADLGPSPGRHGPAAAACAPQFPAGRQPPAPAAADRQRHRAGRPAGPPARPRSAGPARQLAGLRRAQRTARFPLPGEIEAWQQAGVLQRVDMVFSRDQAERFYVQHRLLQRHEEVRAWIARGTAIYVCGSLQGMAAGVDAALRQIAGDAPMRELAAGGRYRRDVY